MSDLAGKTVVITGVEVDEEVMERYFEGTPPTDKELSRLIVKSITEGSLVPILCCSAKQDIGLTELLDAIVMCGLPADAIQRTAQKDGEAVQLEAKADGPLVGLVFKTRIDPFVQKLSFLRIFSGTLKKDANVPVSTARKGVKMGQLLEVQGSDTNHVDSAGPGRSAPRAAP